MIYTSQSSSSSPLHPLLFLFNDRSFSVEAKAFNLYAPCVLGFDKENLRRLWLLFLAVLHLSVIVPEPLDDLSRLEASGLDHGVHRLIANFHAFSLVCLNHNCFLLLSLAHLKSLESSHNQIFLLLGKFLLRGGQQQLFDFRVLLNLSATV